MPRSESAAGLGAPRAVRRQFLQERVAAAIIAAAAEVLARGQGSASMADVAAAAGVARATVYRYFPTRDSLLERVTAIAISDAGARLEEAKLPSIAPEAALARAVRAFFDVGDFFIVIARERAHHDSREWNGLVETPLRQLFARGQKARVFRSDVPPEWLAHALVGLVEVAASASPPVGRDDAIDRICSVFLDGIRRARPAK